MRSLRCASLCRRLALGLGLIAVGQGDVVVRPAQPDLKLQAGTRVTGVVFSGALATAGSVSSPSLELAPGARVLYEKSTGLANQRLAADLVLVGDAALVNDNAWTHMAHMLRVEGRLRGSGTLTVDGAGDGGVLLTADSRATFDGPIEVVGGNLIVGHPGALGAAEATTTLRGGRVSIHSGETAEPLVFAGDAALHTGVGAALLGPLTIESGATARLDTGGGNTGRHVGVLGGEGALVFRGGGRSPSFALAPFTLAGHAPNTLSGPVTIERGTLALGKPPGVTAIAGELRLGGGSNLAVLRLGADEQIADGAPMVTLGDERAILWSDGHAETLGVLRLGSDAAVRMGPGADRVRFAASARQPWRAGCELIVEHWAGAAGGSGEDRLLFGEGGSGLTAAQLAQIGFRDPSGRDPGLYTARLTADGEVLPNSRVGPDAGNAFAIDAEADAERARRFESDGLARLTATESPLPEGSVVSFFGDSITWQHGFIGRLERALAAGEGTRGRRVDLRNRGINGGGVRDLRDGSSGQARAGARPGGDANAPQAPFEDVLAEDRPRAVVIFIGINDVNWRGTSPEEFTSALTTLVRAAHGTSADVVVATLLLGGERPDGTNEKDVAIDRFAELTRQVARREGATLVDLRRAAMAWLQNHNRRLRLDGTLEFEGLGLLTYDGVHPTDAGNALIAELLSDGLVRALSR